MEIYSSDFKRKRASFIRRETRGGRIRTTDEADLRKMFLASPVGREAAGDEAYARDMAQTYALAALAEASVDDVAAADGQYDLSDEIVNADRAWMRAMGN